VTTPLLLLHVAEITRRFHQYVEIRLPITDATPRTAPRRNSAGALPELADLRKNTTRNAGGTPLAAASSCVTDFFRYVFVERGALHCVQLQ